MKTFQTRWGRVTGISHTMRTSIYHLKTNSISELTEIIAVGKSWIRNAIFHRSHISVSSHYKSLIISVLTDGKK